MKRKHVATGEKPPGGKREGAGRKPGSKNLLALGEVKAVKAAGLRVPDSASKDQRELADESLDTITRIMRGRVHWQMAGPMLKASTHLREEICGAIKQRVEHTLDNQSDEQLQARLNALMAKAKELPGGAGQTAQATSEMEADPGPNGETSE